MICFPLLNISLIGGAGDYLNFPRTRRRPPHRPYRRPSLAPGPRRTRPCPSRAWETNRP